MKRAFGHFLGQALWFSSAVAAAAFFFLLDDPPLLLLGAAAISAAVGYWLMTRLYLDDPEAMAEYQAQAKKQPLSESLKSFNTCATLLKVMTVEDARAALASEMERHAATFSKYHPEGIALFLAVYEAKHIKGMMQTGIRSLAEFQRSYLAECKVAKDFSALWVSLCGNALRLDGMNIVDHQATRELFYKEFEGVAREELRPSAPTPEQLDELAHKHFKTHSGLSTIGLLVQASDFCLQIGVDRSFIATVIVECEMGKYATLPILVEEGLIELHRRKLVDRNWAERKFSEMFGPGSYCAKLWDAQQMVNLRDLLETGLIGPGVAAHLFSPEYGGVPIVEELGPSSERNNVVLFMEYWSDVLSKYGPVLIPSRLHFGLHEAHTEWTAVKNDIKTYVRGCAGEGVQEGRCRHEEGPNRGVCCAEKAEKGVHGPGQPDGAAEGKGAGTNPHKFREVGELRGRERPSSMYPSVNLGKTNR